MADVMSIEELADVIPPDPDDAIRELLNYYASFEDYKFIISDRYDIALDVYGLLYSIVDNDDDEVMMSYELDYDTRQYPVLRRLDFNASIDELIQIMNRAFAALGERNRRILSARNFNIRIAKAKSLLGRVVAYKFTTEEVNELQGLINNIRDYVVKCELFEDQHKRRILGRLEALQKEIHKKMSDLDRFWGLIGDAGVALGKFGKDAKPFVDMIKDMTRITWNAQARAEEIEASDLPLLSDEAGKRAAGDAFAS